MPRKKQAPKGFSFEDEGSDANESAEFHQMTDAERIEEL
jgi:hypothetical protein